MSVLEAKPCTLLTGMLVDIHASLTTAPPIKAQSSVPEILDTISSVFQGVGLTPSSLSQLEKALTPLNTFLLCLQHSTAPYFPQQYLLSWWYGRIHASTSQSQLPNPCARKFQREEIVFSCPHNATLKLFASRNKNCNRIRFRDPTNSKQIYLV